MRIGGAAGTVDTLVTMVGLAILSAGCANDPRAARATTVEPNDHQPAVARAAQQSSETAPTETPFTLTNGTRFLVPRSWSVRTEGSAVILGAPEGDSHIAIVDAAGAGDADAAVAMAWAMYRPGFSGTAPAVRARAREGWDEMFAYRYAIPANEHRSLVALASRKGTRWTVRINDLTDAVVDRRDAQLEVIGNSILPEGYERETFAGRPAHPLDTPRVAQLTELIEIARNELNIPGVALGLIDNGKVVFAGGFGVRELGRPEKMDADTLFNIASNGKAMTTLMLAKLVEAGRFGWDTPVVSLWPEFRLGDAETTRRVQVRHLVCACTGMPRQDREWEFEGENSTPDSMMRLLFTAQPTTGFGDVYQYSNLMPSAAGFLAGRILYPGRELGEAYDTAMQTLVFDPLGMKATTFDIDGALAGNHSAGHDEDVDGNMRITSQGLNRMGISTRPSGAIWSNVRDMLRFVQMELDRGLLPNGRRYIREDVLLERRVPQVTEGLYEYYGMGLKIDRQRGVPVIRHGGSMVGYKSDMIWLPDHGVGAVILINSDTGALLRSAFRRRLLEVLFDGKPIAIEDLKATAARMRADASKQRQRLTVPADPQAVAGLAPRYRSAELGELVVSQKDGATWFDFGGWSTEVATRRGEEGPAMFLSISPGEGGYEFIVADRDGERRLIIRDAQHEYAFTEEK